METDWAQRREIEEKITRGVFPSADEVESLIADADEADEVGQVLDGLERVMRDLGYEVQDVTTDDSEGRELQVVEVEDTPTPLAKNAGRAG